MKKRVSTDIINKVYDVLVKEEKPFKALLEEYELTQTELADILERSQTCISYWCKKTAPLNETMRFNLYVSIRILEDFEYGNREHRKLVELQECKNS